MFVPLAIGTSASEKNAPRNPWIIVFFFPGSSLSQLECHFFGYITVYPSFRHYPTLIWANEVLYHVEPFFEGREQQIEIVLEQDNHLLLAHGGCFDPIDQIGSVARYGPCFHMFSPRHGEKMRLVADTGDIIKENGIIVS